MALTKWQPPVLRNLVKDKGEVVWLELYFDLIYVAALIQLGDKLADDVSGSGVMEFAATFGLLWWTWTGTTAFMNRFAVDDIWHRVLVFAQMFAVGNLALVAVSPIDGRSSWLAVAYVGARIPLILMYARVRSNAESRGLATFYMQTFTAGALIWMVSLLVPTPIRYGVWAFALAIEFAAPFIATKRTDAPPIHEEHFRERYALFTIIVLGEAFVKTLSELADIGLSAETQVFGGLTFVIGIAIWWTYFDDVADSTIRPGPRNLILPWVYSHLPLAMAATSLGVASKKVVSIPAFDSSIKDSYLWLLVGSIAVILVATAILDLVTVSPHFAVGMKARIAPRIVAAVLVLLIPLVIGTSPALGVVALVAVVVAGQIAFEVVVASRAEKRMTVAVARHVTDLGGTCSHLDNAVPIEAASTGCLRCEAEGKPWVELRGRLTCGFVGCCDDTPAQHARMHHEATGHGLIASLQPGARWAYCFAHDVIRADWRVADDQV